MSVYNRRKVLLIEKENKEEKGMLERIRYVLDGEDGMGTLEYAGLAVLVIIIIVAFFKFKDKVVQLVNNATGRVGEINSKLNDAWSSMP